MTVNSKFQYSENNKKEGTKAVFLTYTGFTLSNKLAFYIEGSEDMYYLSPTLFHKQVSSGILKPIN
jgi:hypothetical protein